jgi:hypothetical protein
MKGKIPGAEPVCVIVDADNRAEQFEACAVREIGVRQRGQIFGVTVP